MRLMKMSGTLVMADRARELAKSGRKIYNLDVGEPDFETPDLIERAAIEAMTSGFTHYTPSRGIIELRQAISEDLKRRGFEADSEEEIIVTPGAKHAIYCACLATLDPGSEVLVLTPTWPTHFTCVEVSEAKVVPVPCGEAYVLSEEALKKKITNKTKMVIVNSPNNPTGGVLDVDSLKAIADLAIDQDFLVLSDEIYDQIVYDGVETKSMPCFEGARDRVIVVNGFSKTYAMTGWRLGYAFANKTIMEAMNRVQQATTTCAASFIQKAGIAALRGPQDSVREMVEEYDRRRRFIVEQLNEISGISCAMPKGAFYVFPDFSRLKMPSVEISNRLLEEHGVCSTPGIAFGECGEDHIRLSYSASFTVISGAIEKIKEFAERYVKA